jgi:hypothetical protein
MFDFFFTSEQGVGLLIGLIAVAGGLLIAIVAVVADFLHKQRRLDVEGALKQQMLDRGMSAGEIEQVLHASIGGKPNRGCGG